MRTSVFGLTVFSALFFYCLNCQGQQCLKLFEEIERLDHTTDWAKSQRLIEGLIVKLDSNICDRQIGYPELYNNLGLILWQNNDQKLALRQIDKAISIQLLEVDSFSTDMLPFYDNLFALYKDYGQYDKARQYLNLAEKALQNHLAHDIHYVNHLIESGIFHREIGLFDISHSKFDLSTELIEKHEVENDSIAANILIESATLRILTGEIPQAEEDLNRAINLIRSNFPRLHARAVDRLGKLKMETGELSDSESNLLSNIKFKESHFPEDSILMVESFNNLGILYFRINDLLSSREYFLKLSKIGDRHSIIKPYALNNLGAIEMKEGNLTKAREYFQKSCELFKDRYGTLHQEYANSLTNLASTYNKAGDHNKALSLYNQVLDLDKTLFGKNHPKYASSLGNIAHIYSQMGYYEVARKLLIQSAQIKKAMLGDQHHERAKSMNELGLIELALGDTTRALQLLDSALDINIRHVKNIFPVLTDNQRNRLFEQISFSQRRFSSIAFTPKYFDSEWSQKALDYSINTKSILFFAADKMRNYVHASGDLELKTLYDGWRKLGIELANAYLLTDHERQLQSKSIVNLESKYHNLEKRLSQKASAFGSQDDTAFTTWDQISNSLNDSTALVEILEYKPFEIRFDSVDFSQGFTADSHYVGFIIKPGGILEKVRWPEDTEFKSVFARYKNLLKFGIEDTFSYNELWRPIDDHLDATNLVFVAADGDWYKVNPSTFFDPLKKEYVEEKYNTLNITSGKDLLVREKTNWSREAFIFGNPDFSVHNQKLAPLPGAEEEAREIGSLFRKGDWSAKTFVGRKATEIQLKQLDQPGIVHIATHGFFNEDNMSHPLLNSGLMMHSKNEGDDGVLTAYEAMNLSFDETLLVVLSACETGLGEVRNGEGVFGLQRAFLVAGAQYLLISLSKVDDLATRNFMNLFYQNFIESNEVESAFFKARATFRVKNKTPRDWGAFVLISNQ